MNLRRQYIEISSEEEMKKASKWLKSLGYINPYCEKYDTNGTYLFISGDIFHFNNESKKSNWVSFSVLYDNGMPIEEEDLLSKAKRLYPIGTQYKCAAEEYEVFTVESMNWASSPSGYIYGEDGKGCIYKHGKWAKIIHEAKPVEQKEDHNFIVGKWYKTVEHNYYAKCFNFTDAMKASQYSVTGYNDGKSGKYKFCSGYKWVEATQEELARLLPEGHPDLIVKPIEKWSVGTYVVFFNNSTWHNVKLGTIDKIKYNIDEVGDAWFEDYGCCSRSRLDVDVKWFATLEEAEKFAATLKEPVPECIEWKPKVGDWVVTDNLSNGNGGMYEGNLGQVWQIGKIIDGWYSPIESMKFTGGSLELHNLRKVTISEINSVNYVDKKEELLEQAKKKYPVGTRYKTASYSGTEYVVEKQTFEYDDGNIRGEDGKGILYREDKWAEIIEPPKAEVLTSNQTTYQPIVTSYSYNGVKETHQSINIAGKKFSPIKAELIKVKQLKIN